MIRMSSSTDDSLPEMYQIENEPIHGGRFSPNPERFENPSFESGFDLSSLTIPLLQLGFLWNRWSTDGV